MCEGMTDTFLRAAHSGGAAASLASGGRAPGGSRLRYPRNRGKLVAGARPARCRPGGQRTAGGHPAPPPRCPGRELAAGTSPDPLLRRTCPAGARGGSRAAPGSASSPRPPARAVPRSRSPAALPAGRARPSETSRGSSGWRESARLPRSAEAETESN